VESPVTPTQVYAQRLRELRKRRGWTQGQLAERARVDRTTINKIEKGVRSDVSISQLFWFADVLATSPIHLLTPTDPDVDIELSPGGRRITAVEARNWLRGFPPPGVQPVTAATTVRVHKDETGAIRSMEAFELGRIADALEKLIDVVTVTISEPKR
jgi:transcriptional regulator with XRE-family HTH domain